MPTQIVIIERLIKNLEKIRRHKRMYFTPIAPGQVEIWLVAMRETIRHADVHDSIEDRRVAVERRGLKYDLALWETKQLAARGLADEAIVDELLAIEIEMWQLTLARAAASDSMNSPNTTNSAC